MGQQSFSEAEYAGKRKKTRRERFLEEMELVVQMEGAAEGHRAVLPGGRSWPQALPRIDAARAPDAELVRAERPCDGGSTV
jgi:hypothetical protein